MRFVVVGLCVLLAHRYVVLLFCDFAQVRSYFLLAARLDSLSFRLYSLECQCVSLLCQCVSLFVALNQIVRLEVFPCIVLASTPLLATIAHC